MGQSAALRAAGQLGERLVTFSAMDVRVTSPWVPFEWIAAHGLRPRGVWASPELNWNAQGLAAGVCPFANAVLELAGRQHASAVIFTTHCDQLRRAYDAFEGGGSERVFLFNLPATWQTPAAERLFLSELERLGRFLVGLGGHHALAGDLGRLSAEYCAGRRQLLDAADSVWGTAYAEAVARFHWNGTVVLPGAAGTDRGGSVRVALLGGPVPEAHRQLYATVEQAGARIVLNGTDSGERSLLPGVAGGIEAATRGGGQPGARNLAHVYTQAMTEVFQRPNTRLYAWLRQRLGQTAARGILLWHFVGCDLWRGETQSLRDAFSLPVLSLDSDETAADSSRTANRVAAFVEQLCGQAA